MHPTLFTLGYEGLTIEAFIARLQAAQVKTGVNGGGRALPHWACVCLLGV
jgi:hypothetical protein